MFSDNLHVLIQKKHIHRIAPPYLSYWGVSIYKESIKYWHSVPMNHLFFLLSSLQNTSPPVIYTTRKLCFTPQMMMSTTSLEEKKCVCFFIFSWSQKQTKVNLTAHLYKDVSSINQETSLHQKCKNKDTHKGEGNSKIAMLLCKISPKSFCRDRAQILFFVLSNYSSFFSLQRTRQSPLLYIYMNFIQTTVKKLLFSQLYTLTPTDDGAALLQLQQHILPFSSPAIKNVNYNKPLPISSYNGHVWHTSFVCMCDMYHSWKWMWP